MQESFCIKPKCSRLLRSRNHIYFCETVPLKACAKFFRNGCWRPGVMSDLRGSHTPGRLTQRSMIPRGDELAGVWDPGEILTQILTNDSPGYDTLRSMKPRGDWLCAVWYSGEIDSRGYDTWKRIIKIRITQQNRKYFNPLVQWPRLVQMMKKKTWGRKSLLTIPLKYPLVSCRFIVM